MKKRKVVFSILIGCLIILCSDACSQDIIADSLNKNLVSKSIENDTSRIISKSPTGAMVRSLLFPGLGQWYNNKKFKALVVFGAQTGLIANSIYLNQKLVQSQDDWEREFYINNRNLSVWWLVGATLFSIADAFVDAHLFNFDESPDLTYLKISPIISVAEANIQVSMAYHF